MSFSSIWNKVKEILRGMFGLNKNIEQVLQVVPAVSDKMAKAIDQWTAMYMNEADWLHDPTYGDPTKVVSLGLPAFIASEKARMAVIEFKSEIVAPTTLKEEDNPEYQRAITDGSNKIQSKTIITEVQNSPPDRAKYMNKQYQDKLLTQIRTQLEYGIAKGSLIIKPYVHKAKKLIVPGLDEDSIETEYIMDFDFIQADCFYPLAFSSNKVSEVVFLDTHVDNDLVYTRVEHHKLVGNSVIIENKAFESSSSVRDSSMSMGASLGTEVDLSKVSDWKDLPRSITIKNVDRLLFGYFKMPEANTIDPHSPLGISGFARAVQLIKDADEQYSRLLWEYEGGELAIDIDRDALTTTKDEQKNVHTVMGRLQQRLYRPVDLGESDTYKPYAPALRDSSIINGLNNILMRIEDVCALSRGTLSDVAAEARTATEIRILKQRSYSSNLDIQKALENALKDVVYVMDVYCTLYNIVGDIHKDSKGKVDTNKIGKYDVSFDWDDSILVDVDTELNRKLTLMNNGIESKLEVRMWYHGEDKRQAAESLKRIREENQEAIEQNAIFSSEMGKQLQNQNEQSQSTSQPQEQENPQEQKEESTT